MSELMIILTIITVAVTALLSGNVTAFLGMMALSWWLQVAADLTVWHVPVAACISAPMAVYWTWQWWNRWKDKRRKARALAGAKTRALREALVRRLAERRVPVLVPS